jgi:hypothetical protein
MRLVTVLVTVVRSRAAAAPEPPGRTGLRVAGAAQLTATLQKFRLANAARPSALRRTSRSWRGTALLIKTQVST